MERLTKRCKNGNVTLEAAAFTETQETIDREIRNFAPAQAAVERLAEFEDAEEKGLLFRLPDIPQDAEMYAVLKGSNEKYHIRKLKLTMWEIRHGVLIGHLYDGNWNLSYYPSDDGTERQYIYRTRDEAQQVLKERENK